MHDEQSRLGAELHDDESTASISPPDVAVSYCNPCLGVPLITIESPLFFFGIQVAAGFMALLALLLSPFGPAGRYTGDLP
jgi:hypothetical protein